MNQINSVQRTAEIARRLAELGETKKALNAYALLIHQAEGQEPQLALEGALYIFQNDGDYQIAYGCFRKLYNEGHFREDLFPLMAQAFYLPNVKQLKSRYEKNCKLLAKYPYLFRKDFPKFEDLPLLFFPYDDNGYIVYDPSTDHFGPYTDYSHEVVSRNFFADLTNPILAADVFSQHELEYLNDNVRKSEWVARENHIYLHYTDWAVFCAHLQVLNLRPLLADRKFVFLIDEEIEQYPIDFKARFGIDYSKCEPVSIHSREIHRLIWHTQLASHNGGDFFNEIFDSHPNLISLPSVMFDKIRNVMETLQNALQKGSLGTQVLVIGEDAAKSRALIRQLQQLPNRTERDLFITVMLALADLSALDESSRIVPAIFFQPHFPNINFSTTCYSSNVATLYSPEYEEIRNSAVFKAFKYIKTFTPIRRPTTSCSAAVRFMKNKAETADSTEGAILIIGDNLFSRILNRSFMIDEQDRLFRDSVMVRFEDGKLNPNATFRALAAFLDLPYTESMTYCSVYGQRNAESYRGNDIGFSTGAVYRTYDEFLGTPERYVLEYFLQDLYEYCGYGLQYYDGEPMDEERAEDFLHRFTVLDTLIRNSCLSKLKTPADSTETKEPVQQNSAIEDSIIKAADKFMSDITDNRRAVYKVLIQTPRFVNKNGQPLHMMPLLQLDPELLEQPLYH